MRGSWISSGLYLRQSHYHLSSPNSHSGATPSDTGHPIVTCSSCTSLEVCPFKLKQTKRTTKKRETFHCKTLLKELLNIGQLSINNKC